MVAQRTRPRERRRAEPEPVPASRRRSVRGRRSVVIVGAAIVVGALALYVATAARDIVFGDTPELTGVALTLGVAHPPGYPLWTMIAWAFAQVPLGPPPFRVAMVSVVCHAATVAVVYAATYRFTGRVPAAAVAAVALALEPIFWAWSLVGEVFALSDLLAASLLFLVALWHEHPERKRLLVAGGLVGGLGMANHQTIVLVAPAVAYVLWLRRVAIVRAPLLLPATALAFTVGLLPYAELLWAAARHPAFNWGDLRTPADLVGHVLRLSYGTTALIADENGIGGSVVARVLTLFTSSEVVEWSLLGVGAFYAWRLRRWYAAYLLVAFTVAGPLFIAYTNVDVSSNFILAILERFYLLPHTVVAPLAGFAVVGLGDLALGVRLARRDGSPVVAALALLALLALVPLRYGAIDESGDRWARTFGEDMLRTLKPGSLFFGQGDAVLFPVWYLQRIEGARPDVVTVGGRLLVLDWYVRELRRTHPEVPVPDERYGPDDGMLRTLFEANRAQRPLAASGDISDESTLHLYWFYPRGLTFEIRPLDQTVFLDDMDAENAQLIAGYRPPPFAEAIRTRRRWERATLFDYASAYYRVGRQYEIAADPLKATDPPRAADLSRKARSWYEQALKVHPVLQDALDGMARVTPK